MYIFSCNSINLSMVKTNGTSHASAPINISKIPKKCPFSCYLQIERTFSNIRVFTTHDIKFIDMKNT